MRTVGQQGGSILPVGMGIGATQDTCDVMSPMRAAGMKPMSTLVEPIAIMPGPAGTQPGNMHGADISVTRAAGTPPIRTFGWPLIIANGNGGCGTGVGVGAGG